MQDYFSFTELATMMISAGFGAQLVPFSCRCKRCAINGEFIVRAGAVNVEEQLTEMAIGVRQQFDIAGVALAMGSAGLSAKIKIDDPLERRLVSDIAVAGMSSVVRGHFDVENLAIQLITDAAAVGMQPTKPNTDDYHQSQMASQGAGHITQTTIEQQWESQLINDAEFTANRQLPSVTFDVNNEALAQRVGEEVSHFYHPTPPPRNPSGFWQRTWHSVEDVFEHRALIAEGRAAANSEVMSESLGHAAVNQQNYLDLGYSESNAQYGAAWLAMSEISSVPIAKGIQLGIKISRLLDEDKWWFLRETASEKSARLTEVQYRQMKMLKENTGYNVSPESWFEIHPQIGENHTYITDYEAIAKVLGSIQTNTKIGVNLLFPKQDNISLFKAFKLEYHLGLEYWTLYNRGKGFRFSEVSNIAEKFPRSPLNGNNFFKRGYGLPGMGPEIGIDPISTRPWPWN